MKNKNIITVIVFIALMVTMSLSSWLKPQTAFSEAERRPLAQKPEISIESVTSGDFMNEFSEYSVDQFPLREYFRRLKAFFATYIFNQKDNNGLFTEDGHIFNTEYPVNPDMVTYAKERFDYIYNTYLEKTEVKTYLSIVPDKNYFLSNDKGYLKIDYDAFINDFKESLNYMSYIDIVPLLSLDDYYRTDSHWKQENICDIAEHLGSGMGALVKSDYELNTLDNPFRGVYLGQSALDFEPDTIKYLSNDILSSCIVNYLGTGKPVAGDMYNMEKANGKDPYEMFLSGTEALVEIINPNAKTDKELIIFRDSYASSLAPLMVPGYKKVTLVDIRYIQSNFIGNFIEFGNQDVLFIYSTTLLNNASAMR